LLLLPFEGGFDELAGQGVVWAPKFAGRAFQRVEQFLLDLDIQLDRLGLVTGRNRGGRGSSSDAI
jgi:hypothetical protein